MGQIPEIQQDDNVLGNLVVYPSDQMLVVIW